MREMEERLRGAQTEEQCQAVGNLGRDVAISLGQAVYDPESHGATDSQGTKIGRDDAKRMLDAYIEASMTGSGNAEFRSFAKSAVQQATALSHKRTATPQCRCRTRNPRRRAPFSADEMKRILDSCERYPGNADRMKVFVLTMRHSGLRIGDTIALKRDRLKGNRLFLYTQKTGTAV
jgi:integrase